MSTREILPFRSVCVSDASHFFLPALGVSRSHDFGFCLVSGRLTLTFSGQPSDHHFENSHYVYMYIVYAYMFERSLTIYIRRKFSVAFIMFCFHLDELLQQQQKMSNIRIK